ncbi:MAG: hypothetical protein EA412_07880 [Chitinophagaceae bacterium]|nr:MAG: hypothetical protein EA412_07880 [Chitinophagaceae bacterium]
MLLLNLYYLPPIEWFAYYVNAESIYIEACENYQKRSFRNRCYITGADGVQRLSIPLMSGKHSRKMYKEVEISYSEKWVRDHWKSLCTSYRSSPYFEYYESQFSVFYKEDGYKSLFSLNSDLLSLLLKILKIDKKHIFTESYKNNYPDEYSDLREKINPVEFKKKIVKKGDSKPYYQVFNDRNGFVPDLSIVDLIFNEGPSAIQYLKSYPVSKLKLNNS